jgi:ceramide glucosyltransferase
MAAIAPLMGMTGLLLLSMAVCYALMAAAAQFVWNMQRRPASDTSDLPPVTILKPLCGAEPGLYENLHSFCQQNFHEYQIVFGVADQADPALSIAKRLQAEISSVCIDIVVNPQQHGSNRKVSSLINMLPFARYEVLVVADSDALVEPHYLARIAPLLRQDVGLVTCLYRGVPAAGIWSRLGAMYVNDWFMPSVRLAWLFGHREYVSGLTICMRRETLRAIGGLHAIASQIADDYQLGALVRAVGKKVVLSPYVVKTAHHEPTAASLMCHEVRWLRTIRNLKPAVFPLMFLSFSSVMAVTGYMLAVADSSRVAAARVLLGAALAARLTLHVMYRRRSEWWLLADLWLLPVRDLLLGIAWFKALVTNQVTWKGRQFIVDPDGIMREQS